MRNWGLKMTISVRDLPLRTPVDGRHRKMLIDGQWCNSVTGRTFETRNPATGAIIGTVPLSDAKDIDMAVAAARRAFDGPWSRFKPYERQLLLLKVADLMERHWEEIALSDTTDMGMPITRTLANRNRVLGMLRFYAGMATSIHGQTIGNSLPGEIVSYTRKEPVGVVGAIIPWNAPTAASIWKIGPALATGCTMVLKPSEEAPLTPLLIADLMMEAGVPAGVLNIVTGTGIEAGAPLAAHMDVDKVVFTGSTATGQGILRASAGNMKRVSLELGGKSPVIVCADADMDRAVPVAAMSVFANSGQICIAGSRLFIERRTYEEFVERVSVHAAKLRIGDGADPETEIGPLISPRQLERVTGFIADGKREGARLVTGGTRITEGTLGEGNFLTPGVFAGVTDDMRIAREEIFGPVISAMPFDTLDEVVRRGNDTPYGLGAGVFTRDLGKAHQLANRLRAGSVWVNTYHAIDPAVSFGGYKMSGYGREGGAEHLDEFLNTKGVWIRTD
jgi:aldehyde dehydrogenase (NAD+)